VFILPSRTVIPAFLMRRFLGIGGGLRILGGSCEGPAAAASSMAEKMMVEGSRKSGEKTCLNTHPQLEM
jgi:hypothetical protein